MTRGTAGPVSRRERPAKPALSRAGIVAAAVEIMQAEGLERVTMRRLAEKLDTGPASLYVYVSNTAELHAAILDELLGSVDVAPASADGRWQERLLEVLRSYTAVLFAHPSLARAALAARPSGPHYLALVEAVLGLLHEGGATRRQAAWGVDVLLQLATATAAEQSARKLAPGTRHEEERLTAALRSAPADRYPRIAAVGDELLSGSGPERLDWAFTAAINGIVRTRRPRAGAQRPANRDRVP